METSGEIRKGTNSSIVVRKYQREDHAKVCQTFYNGMVTGLWRTAYWNILIGNSKKPYLLQIVFLFTLYFSSDTFYRFVLYETILQAFWYTLLYYAFWDFASTCLKTDLKDEDLISWTAPKNKGFWVATSEGVVVGTVAYHIQDSTLEIFRLSVDKECRKLGVARQLMSKIEEVARDEGCSIVRAVTSDAQTAAGHFYKKVGYSITGQKDAATNPESWLHATLFPWIHGVHSIQFDKRI